MQRGSVIRLGLARATCKTSRVMKLIKTECSLLTHSFTYYFSMNKLHIYLNISKASWGFGVLGFWLGGKRKEKKVFWHGKSDRKVFWLGGGGKKSPF